MGLTSIKKNVRSLSVMGFLLAAAAFNVSAKDIHEGVASCAGGTCHGATKPLGDNQIQQDEYFIWQQKDAHAGSYRKLFNERSQRIARNLGINVTTAPQCLVCHTDAPPTAARGERFLIEDGIGCEACHGGAGRWLPEHTRPGITLAEKESLGMTPLWRSDVRAEKCLSCHQGDAEHPITHAMMAAGHPPILFELDTFTTLEPPHWVRDADYAKRKQNHDPASDWAIGQAAAAEMFLRSMTEGRLQDGLFPELMNFDCNSCHHSLNLQRMVVGRSAPLAPGAVPFADAHIYWLGVWLDVAAPELGLRWKQRWAAVNEATRSGQPQVIASARAMHGVLTQSILPLVSGKNLNSTQIKKILLAIADTAGTVRSRDFASAEQAAMGALVLADALRMRGEPLPTSAKSAINTLYTAVRSRDGFEPTQYHSALAELKRVLAN